MQLSCPRICSTLLISIAKLDYSWLTFTCLCRHVCASLSICFSCTKFSVYCSVIILYFVCGQLLLNFLFIPSFLFFLQMLFSVSDSLAKYGMSIFMTKTIPQKTCVLKLHTCIMIIHHSLVVSYWNIAQYFDSGPSPAYYHSWHILFVLLLTYFHMFHFSVHVHKCMYMYVHVKVVFF